MEEKPKSSDLDILFDMAKDDIVKSIMELFSIEPSNDMFKYNNEQAEGSCIHLHSRFGNKNGYPDFDPKLWETLMSWALPRCTMVEFSCFEKQTDVIDETIDKIELIDKWKVVTQINIRGRLTADIIKLLKEDFLTTDGRMKWFSLILLNADEKVLLGMDHYCEDIGINGLCDEDIEFIKSCFNDDKFDVRIHK